MESISAKSGATSCAHGFGTDVELLLKIFWNMGKSSSFMM
jgi:hypothetical protein